MQKFFSKKIISLLLLVLGFILGFLLYPRIYDFKYPLARGADFDSLRKVWSIMEKEYPFEQPSEKDRIYGAIQGLVASYGDDYSRFLTEEDLEYFDQNILGKFGGIGAEISVQMGLLVVSSLLPNSPAEQAGLQIGDIISQINGEDISQGTFNEAIAKIRGEIGSSVTLRIVRLNFASEEGQDRETKDITIVRDAVEVPIINTEVLEDKVFLIQLFGFNNGAKEAFRDAMVEFSNSDTTKLIVDLRGNPGGYLTSVVDMLSYFLPQGYVVVKEQVDLDHSKDYSYRSLGHTLLDTKSFKTVVLIDEGSASASEIFAAALRDYEKATIIGETSFGKGSVQELIEFDNNTALKLTVARWLSPKGEYIAEGIVPDILVDNEGKEDVQLNRAVEFLLAS
ncbi:MAG: S41 family peptidase [Candidatus Pacebacteria bacterium]|nr:S41 family peptidase [Candidatus Paceibacterota bacterium]